MNSALQGSSTIHAHVWNQIVLPSCSMAVEQLGFNCYATAVLNMSNLVCMAVAKHLKRASQSWKWNCKELNSPFFLPFFSLQTRQTPSTQARDQIVGILCTLPLLKPHNLNQWSTVYAALKPLSDINNHVLYKWTVHTHNNYTPINNTVTLNAK